VRFLLLLATLACSCAHTPFTPERVNNAACGERCACQAHAIYGDAGRYQSSTYFAEGDTAWCWCYFDDGKQQSVELHSECAA
jgi:hypothetical protein